MGSLHAAVWAMAPALALSLLWVLTPPPQRPWAARPAHRRAVASRPGALDVARMVERLAAVISAGSGLRRAWSAVAGSLPEGELAALARAVAAGGDPRRVATGHLRGSPALSSLGAALAVCERTGAPTAGVLQGLAVALRDLHDASLARRTAFAGPRSTARILLVLPLAGLGLGMLLGGDPLRLLASSGAGNLLLGLGLVLTAAGWWWMRRLISRADPPVTGRVDPSVVLELIAGALESGLPLARAMEAVAESLTPGPDAEALARAASSLRSGVPAPVAAAALPEEFEALGQSAVLAELAGADLARALRSAAQDARRGRARAAEERAARLAVRLVLPTGLTLLPAFVVLGIIPTVMSLLGGALTLTGP
ncbi:type II secretion system F family protein [Brachybacterium muris]|uniref:Pilus assembly protein TadB n=1 Tax=Brachybacterium muris UCD-AY4 TaxID=1249481 RepID=A0A022KXW6_9MICO|nr:type II secretion system F family protein [Brachybacterium muris]EYT49503.1 pilus assembly protein TadB [Brachybacterium muris UCD-AY4]MCT1431337.1 type II secretion system F family protein [Brachybacterium muris]MCT1655037.1 type II secretion system F family protein [Brachybacterium muris]MCT2178719.1 type II secretion system F family protein [Brachybacterium muris]